MVDRATQQREERLANATFPPVHFYVTYTIVELDPDTGLLDMDEPILIALN